MKLIIYMMTSDLLDSYLAQCYEGEVVDFSSSLSSSYKKSKEDAQDSGRTPVCMYYEVSASMVLNPLNTTHAADNSANKQKTVQQTIVIVNVLYVS